MHVPSPETRNVGYRPYLVPTQARLLTVIELPAPVNVTNGPAVPHAAIVGRFEVSRVPDFTVRQAEPAPDHEGARIRS
jgi:hypothetical protein